MSPFEAGQVDIEEPNWLEVFEENKKRWPRLPDYLACDSAFEAVLKRWRRFHSTPIVVNGEDKRQPAPAIDGIVALAELRIFPPRFTIKDVPRTDDGGYQQDDHCWLSISGEQWRITAIEDKMLLLEKGFEDEPATMQIDLSKAKWTKYIEAAVSVLEALNQ
jgi:hypothetical protein